MDRTDTLCPTCSLIHWTPCNAPHEHSPAGCPDDGLDCHPAARMAHCSPVWGGHSPACDRDGTYCALASTHSGPCRPHGAPCAS